VSESATVPIGAQAPDFTLPRSGGGEVSLSSFRGQPVVLVFLRGYT
jgi:thioredoxin-dependent peroxiredoxin